MLDLPPAMVTAYCNAWNDSVVMLSMTTVSTCGLACRNALDAKRIDLSELHHRLSERCTTQVKQWKSSRLAMLVVP